MTRRHPSRTSRPRRRGSSALGVISLVGIAATLVTTAVVVRPAILGAATDDGTEAIALTDAESRTLDNLTMLLGRARAILAIHPRGATPFVEVVLWTSDEQNPGRIDPMEVAVLSHSRIMHTITWYAVDPEAYSGDPSWSDVFGRGDWEAELGTHQFCNRFRSHRDVAPRVIATGIEDWTIRPELRDDRGLDQRLLHIGLQWSPETTDRRSEEPRRGSTTIDVAWLDLTS